MKLGYRGRRSGGRSKSVGVARMAKGEKDVVVVENANEEEKEEPLLLRIGVSVVTELLRVFSTFGR